MLEGKLLFIRERSKFATDGRVLLRAPLFRRPARVHVGNGGDLVTRASQENRRQLEIEIGHGTPNPMFGRAADRHRFGEETFRTA